MGLRDQPLSNQGLVPAQRKDSEERGLGLRDDSEGASPPTLINAVGNQGIDPLSSQSPPDDQRDQEVSDDSYVAATTHQEPGTSALDSSSAMPNGFPPKGGSQGRKASGGAGRHGGPE